MTEHEQQEAEAQERTLAAIFMEWWATAAALRLSTGECWQYAEVEES